MVSAIRTFRVALELHFRELAVQCIVIKKTADQRFTDAEKNLDRLHGFHHSDYARQNAKYPADSGGGGSGNRQR
jgi:hypothetical protein